MSLVAFNCCWFLVLKIAFFLFFVFPSARLNTLHVSPEVRPWMLGAVKVNRVPHMGGTTSPDIAAKEKETAVNADHPTRAPSCGPSLLLLCRGPQGSQTRSALWRASQLCHGRGVLGSLLLGVRAHWWHGSRKPSWCCSPRKKASSARGDALCFARLHTVFKAKGSSRFGKTGTSLAMALQALLFLSEMETCLSFPLCLWARLWTSY